MTTELWIQVIFGLGTLGAATAAILIAGKQKQLAEQITRLEMERDTPILVVSGVDVTREQRSFHPRMYWRLNFHLANAGGASAHDINIRGVKLRRLDGAIDTIPLDNWVGFLSTQATSSITYSEELRGSEPRLVLAMVGDYKTRTGTKRHLDFELEPGLSAELRREVDYPRRGI